MLCAVILVNNFYFLRISYMYKLILTISTTYYLLQLLLQRHYISSLICGFFSVFYNVYLFGLQIYIYLQLIRSKTFISFYVIMHFFIFLSNLLLITEVFILKFHWIYWFWCIWIESLCKLISSAQGDNLTSTFPTRYFHIYLNAVTLAWTFTRVLNKGEESWYLCIILELNAKAFSFSTLINYNVSSPPATVSVQCSICVF